MSNVETFSTIIKDGEELTKINTWLNKFRKGELVRFQSQRVTSDSTKLVLEAQDHKRLRILSSWPPHQSYLATGKTVPYIDIYFTEPVDIDSLYGEVTLNETAIADDKLELLDNDYTLRIDTSGFTMTTAGQYELILGDGVLHANGLWKLHGERKVLWSTSEHGGSRGGEDIVDMEKSILHIAKIIVEGQHDEQKMIKEFYNIYSVDPDCIEYMNLTSGYPEYDKTILWVVYSHGSIPYVKCVNPEYKSCFFQDGAPGEVIVEIGLTESIDEDSLEDQITVDGTIVSDWDLTQDNKLLTVRFTPSQYKHHVVKIAQMKSGDFLRTWPFAFSFVIHKITGSGNADTVTTEAISDDTLAHVLLAHEVSGNQVPSTDPGITYNSVTNTLTTTLNGNATNVTGVVAVANGGTGSATVAGAKDALNIPFISTVPLTNSGSPYTLTSADACKFYKVDTSSGSVTINLPAGSTMVDGDVIGFIKVSAANSLIIARAGSDTIDGATSLTYTNEYSSCIIESGANTLWSVVSESAGAVKPPLKFVAVNTTAVPNEVIVVNTGGGAITIDLPASPANSDTVEIKRSGANTVTVGRNGKNIENVAADDSIGSDLVSYLYRYDSENGTWWKF
jgi:hypothetical protein